MQEKHSDHDESVLERFSALLTAEIQQDLSQVETFERENNHTPYFRRYHSSYHSNPRKIRRTRNGAIARRREIPRFCADLRRESGPGPLVLDIGCGFGSDSILLAFLGCRVIGLDPSDAKVAVAKHRARYWEPLLDGSPAPEFVTGFLEDMDVWPQGTFDGMLTAECLHHCEPVENVLLKMRELIREGGHVFVLESNGGSPLARAQRNRSATGPRRLLTRRGDRYTLYGNENIRRTGAWLQLFSDCGFETRRTHYSRHLLSEISASSRFDETLSSIPGASLACIHVSMELGALPPVDAS